MFIHKSFSIENRTILSFSNYSHICRLFSTFSTTPTASYTYSASFYTQYPPTCELAQYESEYNRLQSLYSSNPIQLRHMLREYSKSIPLTADRSSTLCVIKEDSNLLAVNKPNCIQMHPTHRYLTNSLLNQVLGHTLPPNKSTLYHDETPPVYIVHRLDELTSGVVLFAKNKALTTSLLHAFQKKLIRKRYLALIYIDEVSDSDEIPGINGWTELNEPICRDGSHSLRRMCVGSKYGSTWTDSNGDSVVKETPKSALTRVRVLSVGNNVALVESWPETGRTHQIRVHLAGAGVSIVNDDLYSKRDENVTGEYRTSVTRKSADDDGVLRLHAVQLFLPNELHTHHGVDSSWIHHPIHAKLPPHFIQHATSLGISIPQEFL